MSVPDTFTGRQDALNWLDSERASLIAAVYTAAATGWDDAAMLLPPLLAVHLDWRRRFDDWIAITTVSLEAARHVGDRPAGGIALTSLGVALREVRRCEEAVSACQNAATIYRETGDRHGGGMALNNLGIALQQADRHGEAITAYQGAAAMFRETGTARAWR